MLFHPLLAVKNDQNSLPLTPAMLFSILHLWLIYVIL